MSEPPPFNVKIHIDNKNYKDFNPIDAGYGQCTPGFIGLDEVRHHYLIHYVVSGKGTFTLDDGTTFNISAGQCFIILPYKKYIYQADKYDPWYYIWIGFTGSCASAFSQMNSVYDFKKPELFENIEKAASIDSYRTEYLYAQLLMIYRELAPPEKLYNKYIYKIIHYIESLYMTQLTVEKIAELCSINTMQHAFLKKK